MSFFIHRTICCAFFTAIIHYCNTLGQVSHTIIHCSFQLGKVIHSTLCAYDRHSRMYVPGCTVKYM